MAARAHQDFALGFGDSTHVRFNPSVSEKQRRFMAAALSRKRAGKPRRGDPRMSVSDLQEFARKVRA